jgi:hypothetical protein
MNITRNDHLFLLLLAVAACAGCAGTRGPDRWGSVGGRLDILAKERCRADKIFHLGDFNFRVGLRLEQLYKMVGPPNSVQGSGIEWLVYRLSGGRWLEMYFPPPEFDTLATATLVDPHAKKRRRIIFEAPRR